jgi:tetratricopeptide (TPR) repeat protein
VVHRDIKPDNVLISGGTAVVTDFGIAKAISASRTAQGGATLTQIGTSIGTPAYMAPEQAAGDPDIDHRADLYSLGAMAYELLSGRVVFADRTAQRMLAAHMGEAPTPIAALRPDLPAPLAELVMSCLAKDAARRPQNAGDIARVLETITSGSGMAAMPPVLLGGPGMFRKALAIYAVAFVAVAILAKAAIVGIGLPDWVFPGALVVMALGLPVVLWTGYVQRVTRRAMTATPTYTPGGSPSTTAHGTIATIALKAAPRMSWYRTARGGMYAFGTFIVIIAAFMGMRAFGIGPFGSLVASGALGQDARIVLTDFSVSGGDTTLGRVVSEAVRAGLSQARVFTVVPNTEIANALVRMQQPAGIKVNLALAKQLAQRGGFKAIVDGDVATVGGAYIVTLRLVTADSGRELTSFRATAKGPDQLIDAADQLSRQLLAKAGESLRRVQATPPLVQVTTSSLAALRKYSEANRANDVELDYLKAVRLLREALAIDSTFPEGWRKLAIAMGNQGFPRASVDSAITRAYQLRERLGDSERDRIVAAYFADVSGGDRAKAIAAQEAILARGDTLLAMPNVAADYLSRREYARAEALLRAEVRRRPGPGRTFSTFVWALARQQKQPALDSMLKFALAADPTQAEFQAYALDALNDRGRFAELEHALDSIRRAPPPRDPALAFRYMSQLAVTKGQLRQRATLAREAARLDSTVGRTSPQVRSAIDEVVARVGAGLPAADAARALDAALAQHPIDRLPLANRPYAGLVSAYAMAGRADRATAILNDYRRAWPDTAAMGWEISGLRSAQSALAIAERRWTDAARFARHADSLPDGPAGDCEECLPRSLMFIFSEAGMADSAIAQYQAYRRTPYGGRKREGPDIGLGGDLLDRVARAFEQKGDNDRAAQLYREMIELWKNADPELQPRVAEARRRLAKLTPVERPR